jgi:hypothetical protein
MGKRIELQPAWLVQLLTMWVRKEFAAELGHLGYASGSSWMRGLKASPASSIDPTGFAARDFGDLEAALRYMEEAHANQLAAVLMYYKPWKIKACEAQGHPFGNSTFYERLHRGHKLIADHMDLIKQARAVAVEAMERKNLTLA